MLLLPEVDGGGGGERSLPRRLDAPTVAVTAGGAADGTLADPDMPTIGSYCPGCSRACSCAMKSKARCFRSVLSSLYMRRSGPSLSSLEAMGSEEKCTGGAICTFLTTCRFSRSDAASATNMCSVALGWFCSVSEKSNAIQVKSSQLSVASMAFGELPRLRAHQTADASGRSPARGRHARPHPRPTSWLLVPHMAHGTRPDRKDVNVRTLITWGRAGARPLTSTDHVSPHGGPHCPHPFPFFDFARYFLSSH